MTKIQIVETEELLQYADFDSCEVRLLNRMSYNELDARVINEPELTESPLPSSMKLPQLLSMIWERHPNKEITNERGGLQLRYRKSNSLSCSPLQFLKAKLAGWLGRGRLRIRYRKSNNLSCSPLQFLKAKLAGW